MQVRILSFFFLQNPLCVQPGSLSEGLKQKTLASGRRQPAALRFKPITYNYHAYSVSALTNRTLFRMLGRVIDNSLFAPSLQETKLIALVLNYNLPTQTHKLLQKGATA